MTSAEILGCRVDAIGPAEAVERIASLACGASPAIVVTLGVEMVMVAQRDARFRDVIAKSALSICDTIGILLASRLRGGPLRERITGVGLIDLLAERSARTGDLRLFLLGAAPQIADRAANTLRARFPGVHIAGTRNGYFDAPESAAIAAQIFASGANVLLAGLGSPKQELWLDANLAATSCGVGIGVGGSFDILAGAVPRAPATWQRLGLEWLYRLVREPSRWRRQLALPRFAVAALAEVLAIRSAGTRH